MSKVFCSYEKYLKIGQRINEAIQERDAPNLFS